MYLGIDIGGTKTLLAVFDKDGKVVDRVKVPTAKKYEQFIKDLSKLIKTEQNKYSRVLLAACAAPGRVDRSLGVGVDFGNLPWHNVPIAHDLKSMLHCQVLVENDANLAGLSEAIEHAKYKKVLYLTISTGIGGGLIIDGKIDADFADLEPGQMMISHDGELQKWEKFASGSAIKARYGMLASEINDASIWRSFAVDVAVGLQELLAIIQPDVVIFGGGVGTHFKKYGAYLEGELFKLQNPLVKIPPLLQAKHPEEAVIYGCFELIKQELENKK